MNLAKFISDLQSSKNDHQVQEIDTSSFTKTFTNRCRTGRIQNWRGNMDVTTA